MPRGSLKLSKKSALPVKKVHTPYEESSHLPVKKVHTNSSIVVTDSLVPADAAASAAATSILQKAEAEEEISPIRSGPLGISRQYWTSIYIMTVEELFDQHAMLLTGEGLEPKVDQKDTSTPAKNADPPCKNCRGTPAKNADK